MQHSREGLLAVHAAVLIFGFTALFSKLLSTSALTRFNIFANFKAGDACCANNIH